MAVESRFVVVRQGVEVQTFMDKKGADEYDKMLDMADSLAELFARAPVELTETDIEELAVHFAQHRDDVLVALQAKKAKAVHTDETAQAQPVSTNTISATAPATTTTENEKAKAKPAAKAKKSSAKAAQQSTAS
jgi:dsDNA-binding SOS-regulon protein